MSTMTIDQHHLSNLSYHLWVCRTFCATSSWQYLKMHGASLLVVNLCYSQLPRFSTFSFHLVCIIYVCLYLIPVLIPIFIVLITEPNALIKLISSEIWILSSSSGHANMKLYFYLKNPVNFEKTSNHQWLFD